MASPSAARRLYLPYISPISPYNSQTSASPSVARRAARARGGARRLVRVIVLRVSVRVRVSVGVRARVSVRVRVRVRVRAKVRIGVRVRGGARHRSCR